MSFPRMFMSLPRVLFGLVHIALFVMLSGHAVSLRRRVVMFGGLFVLIF